jgi:hypothetical protein
MTIFSLALALAAYIGWGAHSRVLRRALHEAWAKIDTMEADAAATKDPASHDPSDNSVGELHPRKCP